MDILLFKSGLQASSYKDTSITLARPRNLILRNDLIEVSQDLSSERIPYIAVSYTWDPIVERDLVKWKGRRVTPQALAIATRFAQYTSYAIWIDAICIHQDDQKAKEEEIPKMADIYRGAESVVCIISGVDGRTCEAVMCGVKIMETEAYHDLLAAGDIQGCFLFTTGGANPAFKPMFQHRWWERAWTFQEATLNPRTFLVGDGGHVIPMGDVLKIIPTIRLKAASVSGVDGQTLTLGRPSAFWDSVSAMTAAATRVLTLGEAIGCVWRRDAKERHDLVYSIIGVCGLSKSVIPSYDRPFNLVIRDLFEAAIALGDYSWLTWAAVINQKTCSEGMGLAPTPELVKNSPYSTLTSWRSARVTTDGVERHDGAPAGLLLPYRSTGIIRTQSILDSITDATIYLQNLGHCADEIWDMLFGLQVALMADISRAVNNDGIAQAALNLALGIIKGDVIRDRTLGDMVGHHPYTQGIAFTSYAVMAADSWSRGGWMRLAVMSSQGGTVVIPIHEDVSSSEEVNLADRIYLLPVDGSGREAVGGRDESRGFAFITGSIVAQGQFKVRATAIVIRKPHTGRGKWQLRRIG